MWLHLLRGIPVKRDLHQKVLLHTIAYRHKQVNGARVASGSNCLRSDRADTRASALIRASAAARFSATLAMISTLASRERCNARLVNANRHAHRIQLLGPDQAPPQGPRARYPRPARGSAGAATAARERGRTAEESSRRPRLTISERTNIRAASLLLERSRPGRRGPGRNRRSGCQLAVGLLVANIRTRCSGHHFQLIGSGRRKLPVRCRGDPLHFLTVDGHWFRRAIEIDIALFGAVRDRANRYPGVIPLSLA